MESAGAHLSELYEECARSSGSHPSCDKFFRLLLPVLRKVAARVAYQFAAGDESEDLLQEIHLKLVSGDPSILEGMPRGAASLAYFSVVAANAARDYFRRRGATKRGLKHTLSLDDTLMAVVGDQAERIESSLLLLQIDNCLPSDPKTRTVFGLYYRQGFSAREIASVPGLELSVKGVESMIHRAIIHVRQRLAVNQSTGNSMRNSS